MTTKKPARSVSKSHVNAHPTVLVLHGPNLNMLGTREPAHYGLQSLDEINQSLTRIGETAGAWIETFQSNHEAR